jgi:hypothetical protein
VGRGRAAETGAAAQRHEEDPRPGGRLDGGAKRLRELLAAAVEQFNGGNLSAAISMLELAEMAIREKKIDPTTVERARAEAIEGIRPEQLRKLAENKQIPADAYRVRRLVAHWLEQGALQAN